MDEMLLYLQGSDIGKIRLCFSSSLSLSLPLLHPFLPSFSLSPFLFPSLFPFASWKYCKNYGGDQRLKKINFRSWKMRMRMSRSSQRRKPVGVLPLEDVSRTPTGVNKMQQRPSELRNLGHVSPSSLSLNFSICQIGIIWEN